MIEHLENEIKTLKAILSPEQTEESNENTKLKQELKELKFEYQQNEDNVTDMIQQIMQRDSRIINLENQLSTANDLIEE